MTCFIELVSYAAVGSSSEKIENVVVLSSPSHLYHGEGQPVLYPFTILGKSPKRRRVSSELCGDGLLTEMIVKAVLRK
jgi:hypothetical protein